MITDVLESIIGAYFLDFSSSFLLHHRLKFFELFLDFALSFHNVYFAPFGLVVHESHKVTRSNEGFGNFSCVSMEILKDSYSSGILYSSKIVSKSLTTSSSISCSLSKTPKKFRTCPAVFTVFNFH